jgi:uncharacterized protein (DUF1778 family)
MARKEVKTSKRKESRLAIRASAQVKKILTQAARVKRTNVSQFVLQASLDAAHAVPAKVIPQLRDLFSEPEPIE